MIGTARANPGKHIERPEHFDDPKRVEPLKTVYEALCSLGVDALVSIGGDDTLKTANKFQLYQKRLPEGAQEDPGRSCSQDDRQRLHGDRFHVRLLHRGRNTGWRNPQPVGRCRVD